MQGAQVGLAGVNAAVGAGQLGLQGAQVGLQGTAQGMQGAGMGLQGVQGAQAGYGLANQAGANVANIANQSQSAQQALLNNQMQMGNQKMAYEQSIKNQAVQDYANAQQYPLMQLGTMSNMLRGLPMQASTTNQYAAAPSAASQAIGTIGSGASIYSAMNPTRSAAGGQVKGYAKGGIMSYDMGGEVEEQLESMDEKGLAAQAKESSSPSIRRMAQRLLRERQMSKQPQGTGPMGVQYQAAQPQMPSYAPGGIVAFQQGAGGNGAKSAIEEGGEEDAKLDMEKRLAMPPSTTPPPGGIMGATTQPTTIIPVAPQTNRALQQSSDIPAFMKAEYAEAERRKNAPLSEFMAERQAAMREAGVADISEGQQKQRAELMAEKANMADEKERQRHLRLAEFFASWGSTPGPTLVAGMNALKQSVPGIISDEKEQKKARREIDKSIADLDNATRLEKRGEVDAAMALKLKAAEDMKALNAKFIDYQSRRESDASSAAASKYSADMQFRSEQLRSQTSALDRAARRDTDKDTKIFGQWQAASKTEADVLGRIQREENDKQHMEDLKAVKLGLQTGTGEDEKFDRTKVPPAVLTNMEEAQKRIEQREKNWKQRIKTAAENTDIAYNRIAIRPEVAARDYTRPTGEPQAGASTRPALTDPSLQRQ
jgi:soluble cytochrome b562